MRIQARPNINVPRNHTQPSRNADPSKMCAQIFAPGARRNGRASRQQLPRQPRHCSRQRICRSPSSPSTWARSTASWRSGHHSSGLRVISISLEVNESVDPNRGTTRESKRRSGDWEWEAI